MAEKKKPTEQEAAEQTAKEETPKAEVKAEKKAKTPAAKKEKKAAKAAAPAESEEAAPKKARKKPKRRLVPEGKVFIQASFNNTIVTIATLDGQVLTWGSAGASGFKGPKKATPYAAQVSAEKAAEKAKIYGMERVHVVVKGAGNGREQAIRGLQTGGLNIESISDVTAIPHNGCRPRKSRRV